MTVGRSPTVARRAIVIGGSMGGLFAANLLYRAGWQIAVYERASEELAGRGAGIVTYPQLLRMLAEAGAKVDGEIGVQVFSRVVFDVSGHRVCERRMPQLMTSWSRLRRLLREALPAATYHPGKSLVAIEQDARGVTAILADGDRVEGDLLVGADGFRSTLRGVFLPEVRPIYAGYVAWRGLVDEARLSPATHATLFEKFAFCLPPGEQVLGYPVAGADDTIVPGHRRYNIVWYRPAEDAPLRRLLTDETGRCHYDGIPPHLVSPAIVQEIRETAARELPPQWAEIVQAVEQPMLQPIYDLESPRLVFGRAVVIGDAAFVARPHCGIGIAKAAGDALALADAFKEPGVSIDQALARFETERVRFGKAAVARARRLGAPLQTRFATAADREMAERYRIPEAILRDTAVMFD